MDAIKKHMQEMLETRPFYRTTRPVEQTLDILRYKDGWVRGWTGSDTWYNFGLVYGGIPLYEEILPSIRAVIGNDAPILMAGYSALFAGGIIPPHKDENEPHSRPNVCHVGLSCPKFTWLHFSDTSISEEDGKIIWFDDAREHAASNLSGDTRVILYVKIDVSPGAS
jgi:hypothetical protein